MFPPNISPQMRRRLELAYLAANEVAAGIAAAGAAVEVLEVFAPSLRGVNPERVGEGGRPFVDAVAAFPDYTREGGSVLRDYHIDLEVENGVYTGNVTVRER